MVFFLFQIGDATTTELVGRRRRTKFYTGPIYEKEEPKPQPPSELIERAELMLSSILTTEQLNSQKRALRALKAKANSVSAQKVYLAWINERILKLEDELEDDELMLLH